MSISSCPAPHPEERRRSLSSGRASRGPVGRVSKDEAGGRASWFETAQARLLTMRGEKSSLRPLVEYALGFAERALQRLGRHGPDARGDANGVLDMGGDPLGVFDEPGAGPAF